MPFKRLNQTNKRGLKRIICYFMLFAGLAVAVGAHIKDENYGLTAQLATIFGLLITICSSMYLFSPRYALFIEKNLERNKKLVLSVFVLISIFLVLLFVYTDIAVYRLPQHRIQLNDFYEGESRNANLF